MKKSKLIVLIIVAAAIAAFFIFDLGKYFSLDYFKSQQAALATYNLANPLQTALIFLLAYIVLTALSLPGPAIMTLVAAHILGLV